MPILIDGNNLMFSLKDSNRGAVRRLILDLTRRERISVILVFDGPPPDPSRPREVLGSVEIRYSGGSSADDAIIRVLRNSAHPKNWTLVTDDGELRGRARRLGASILSCSEWKSRRRRNPQTGRRNPRRKEASLSPGEIEEWISYFDGGRKGGGPD